MSRTLKIVLTAFLVAVPLIGRTAGKNADVVVLETDLVSNAPGLIDGNGFMHSAFITDPNLVNPWGITESAASPFWIADNNAGVSTLYNVPGPGNTPVSIAPRVVSIPSPGDPLGRSGTPTGTVFNTDSAGFKVVGVNTLGTPV